MQIQLFSPSQTSEKLTDVTAQALEHTSSVVLIAQDGSSTAAAFPSSSAAPIVDHDDHMDLAPMTIDVQETNRKYASVSPGSAALKRLAADSEDSGSNTDSTTSMPSTEPSTTPDEASSRSGNSGPGPDQNRNGKSNKRARIGFSSEPSSSLRNRAKSHSNKHTQLPHPLGIKPLGNAFLSDRNDRNSSLGLFARFQDDFLLSFLSTLADEPATLANLEAVSHGFYTFINATNSIWRQALLLSFGGKMKRWCGSWKRTFIWHYKMDKVVLQDKTRDSMDAANFALLEPPAPRIQSPYIFSDTLYHPFRLAMAPLDHLVAPACRVYNAVTKIDLAEPGSIATFKDKFAYVNKPAIVQNAMPAKDWPCRQWSLDKLAQRWPNRFFQCEAVRSRLPSYFSYSRGMQHLQEQTWQRLLEEQENVDDTNHKQRRSSSATTSETGTPEDQSGPRDKSAPTLVDTPYTVTRVGPHTFSAIADDGDSTFDPYAVPDESPFYLFDASFADDPHASLEWRVPKFFQQLSTTAADASSQYDMSAVRSDLFSLLGLLRPDHRWIIAGPARSGSGWHKDPNGTSAWNAVLSGRKAWMLLPPHITPPGVYVSQDEAEVTAPLSIAEWLLDFATETRRLYGPEAPRAEDRVLLEGVCEEGQVLYVPSGWWHLVINLEESVALTQNFVSPAELAIVLDFMKNKADQLSGFKRSQVHSDTPPSATLAPGRQAASLGSTTAAISKPKQEEEEECEGGAGFNVFELFCDRLGQFDSDLLQNSLQKVTELEEQRKTTCALIRKSAPIQKKKGNGMSWWDKLKSTTTSGAEVKGQVREGEKEEGGFSFGINSTEVELEDVPW